MTQPARKTNELIARINLAVEQALWSPKTASFFEAEAQKIRSADVAEGDMLLGIVAGLNGDIQMLHRRFKNALAYNDNDIVIISNYGCSLFKNGLFSDAIQVLQGIADKDMLSADIMALSCLGLGLKKKAKQYYLSAGRKEEDFDEFCKTVELPAPRRAQGAFAAVHKSFERDESIWQSLSMR